MDRQIRLAIVETKFISMFTECLLTLAQIYLVQPTGNPLTRILA
ncbi:MULTISPECIES: hypothetical protein [Planktothricoides]|nr:MULTISPECIES: hypothetical protein [Planktothricoides]